MGRACAVRSGYLGGVGLWPAISPFVARLLRDVGMNADMAGQEAHSTRQDYPPTKTWCQRFRVLPRITVIEAFGSVYDVTESALEAAGGRSGSA